LAVDVGQSVDAIVEKFVQFLDLRL
jgi:hypothetical protein